VKALSEIRRVLRTRGKLALVCIGQETAGFNRLYKVAGALAPAFWGRQVEHHVPSLIEAASLRILDDHLVKQSGYPSRVLVAGK